MSVVVCSHDTRSNLDLEHLEKLAAGLNFSLADSRDAEDYLTLLRSLESVLQYVEESPEFIHPQLSPQPTVSSRRWWKPEKADNPLNAWSHRCDIQSQNPTSSALRNRSVAIKDNVCIGGLPTTCGTFSEHSSAAFPVADIDATVVARILSSGAVIRGSSTCESFCASPLSFTSVTGPVHNPRLHGYTAGGSSSGSCALVAAQMLGHKGVGETVELAIGSDQAGSVRIPASFNGVYGLKPTFGLVPYTGAMSMTPMIDHLGPIAANLEDIAALLTAIAGYDGIDSRMTPESPLGSQVIDYSSLLSEFRKNPSPMGRRSGAILKIGILEESFDVVGLTSSVRDIVYEATKYFKAAGAELIPISVPMHKEGPIIWNAASRPSMSESLYQGRPSGHLTYLPPHKKSQWPLDQDTYTRLTASNPAVVNILLSNPMAQEAFGAAVEAKSHRKVFELRAAYDLALEQVDVLITPCAPSVAMPHPPLIDEQGKPTSIMEKIKIATGVTSNTSPFNVTGHPALNVPCGTSTCPEHAEVPLPVGMQIIGRRFHDEEVILAAALFEEGRRILGEKH